MNALNWLRGRLGESTELVAIRSELSDTRAKLGPLQVGAATHRGVVDGLRRQVADAVAGREEAERRTLAAILDRDTARADRDAALARAAGADAAIAKAFQPERSPACNKQQLPDDDTALWWAERVAADLGETAEDFTVYACQWCPRNPLTGDRWRHIAHVDPDKRSSNMAGRRAHTQALRAKARRDGHLLSQRSDVVAALKGRAS